VSELRGLSQEAGGARTDGTVSWLDEVEGTRSVRRSRVSRLYFEHPHYPAKRSMLAGVEYGAYMVPHRKASVHVLQTMAAISFVSSET